MTFGNWQGTQTELVKFHFKIDDVPDDFAPRSFRVPTLYSGQTGYYTYVTDGFYATDYKLYIDGNVGTHGNGVGNGRGDISLHPKLLDVEGYFRYPQRNGITDDKTYPYWKIKFELDQSNPQDFVSWYNIEDIDTTTSLTDESLNDDVIGTGVGKSKKSAQPSAAKDALTKLNAWITWSWIYTKSFTEFFNKSKFTKI